MQTLQKRKLTKIKQFVYKKINNKRPFLKSSYTLFRKGKPHPFVPTKESHLQKALHFILRVQFCGI